MAPPTKVLREVKARAAKQNISADQQIAPIAKAVKRKADGSPVRIEKVKRSALGNLTNAVISAVPLGAAAIRNKKLPAALAVVSANQVATHNFARPTVTAAKNKSTLLPRVATLSNSSKPTLLENSSIPPAILEPVSDAPGLAAARPTKVLTRAAARANLPKQVNNSTAVKVADPKFDGQRKPTRRISNEYEKLKNEDESMYMSALDNTSSGSLSLSLASTSGSNRSSLFSTSTSDSKFLSSLSSPDANNEYELNETAVTESSGPPEGVVDFDTETSDDPFQVAQYAMDIFNYLKRREELFQIHNYMPMQKLITKWMRSLLIDWMVEVQETFELNHETLYLSVKLVDLYLCKVIVDKENLQLLGAAALFIACKYDERTPPLIDDFLYICDNAYVQKQLITMEMDVFKTIGFDLGIPLSYRFLRRYARCGKIPMPILTLSRFILELSLMDFSTISLSDSKLASAALFMALRMNNKPGWNVTLQYYAGYTLLEFSDVITLLNRILHQKPRESVKTVRNKYSHKIFFEVANTRLMTAEQLFEGTDISYVNGEIKRA